VLELRGYSEPFRVNGQRCKHYIGKTEEKPSIVKFLEIFECGTSEVAEFDEFSPDLFSEGDSTGSSAEVLAGSLDMEEFWKEQRIKRQQKKERSTMGTIKRVWRKFKDLIPCVKCCFCSHSHDLNLHDVMTGRKVKWPDPG
jgi:hypothetical protein